MKMISLCIITVLMFVLAGCAAPLTVQIDELHKATGCCQEVAEIKRGPDIGSGIESALTPDSPLILVGGKRTPAMLFSVSDDFAGKVLRVRAAPSDAGFGARETLRFAPIAVMFLDAGGKAVASPLDSGLRGGPSQSFAYSYAAWRQVTIPATAASIVFYADPTLYGTKQLLNYRYGGLMPVAGIFIPQSADAHAEYTVYGEFSAKVISAQQAAEAHGFDAQK